MTHFSRRTDWPTGPNALTEAWTACRARNVNAIDLTVSNPTAVGLEYPRELLVAALGDPRALRYEPLPRGLPVALEAVARALSRESSIASPDSLVLSASTSEAYAWLMKLLTERGDKLLVPRPSYPLLEFLGGLEEVELTPYPLEYDGAWRIDLHALEAGITPRTRAVVVIHPNNPTGSFVSREEARALGELCARHGLALISDEVFLEYPFAPPPSNSEANGESGGTSSPAASLAREGLPCLTFCLGGLSKSAALPQLKLGWIEVAGPPPLKRSALDRLEVIADTYLSVNTPVQWALPELLASRHLVGDQIRRRIRANYAALATCLGPRSPIELLAAQAGWSAVLRLPEIRSEEEWTLALIEQESLLVHPGYFLDFTRGAYWVLSLLPPEPIFAEACARAIAMVERSA